MRTSSKLSIFDECVNPKLLECGMRKTVGDGLDSLWIKLE